MDHNIETCFYNVLKPAIDPRYMSIIKFKKNKKIKLPCYCVQTIYWTSLSNIDCESYEIRLVVNGYMRNAYRPRLYYQYVQPMHSPSKTGGYVALYNCCNISRWIDNDTNTLNWNNIMSPNDRDLFNIICESLNIKLNDDFDENKAVQVIKDYIIYVEKIKKIEMYSFYINGTDDKNYLACELDIKFKDQKNDDIIVIIEHNNYFHKAVARIFL